MVLHIVGGDIRGRTNSPRVQLRINSTYMTPYEGICVHLSPELSTVHSKTVEKCSTAYGCLSWNVNILCRQRLVNS